jgi:tetratricopeptide (TPR) repeat protein
VEAITWLQALSYHEDSKVSIMVADLMVNVGRTDEAILSLQECASRGDAAAAKRLGDLLRKIARSDEALVEYVRAFEGGEIEALIALADLFIEIGDLRQSISAYQAAAYLGYKDALDQAVEITRRAQSAESAARLGRYGLEPGGRPADPWQPDPI